MKQSFQFFFAAFALLAPFLLISAGCSNALRKPDVGDPIELSDSETGFAKHVSELNNAKGLISCTLKDKIGTPGQVIVIKADQSAPGCSGDRSQFHEYFLFDEDETIFVLQQDPLVYLYIRSKEFHFHLNNEYQQFANNPSLGAADKIKNSQTSYRKVGTYEVALTFTPNEMRYSDRGANKGRLQDRNSASYIDIWRLLDAAGESVVFIPDYTEQRLFTDIYCQVQKGRSRHVYTNDSDLTLDALPDWFSNPNDDRYDQACIEAQWDDSKTIRPWYMQKNINSIKFAGMFGRDLKITEDLLGAQEEAFVDRLAITRPFAFFLSVPMGNTEEADANKDYVSNRHGFAIQFRGQMDFLLDQGAELGLPTYQSDFSPMVVLSALNEGSFVTVNWSEQRQVEVKHYATHNKKTISEIEALSNGDWVTVANEYANETSITLEAFPGSGSCTAGTVSKGCANWFKVEGISTIPNYASVVIGDDPGSGDLRFTEAMWMGTAESSSESDAYDEWFEIKNDSCSSDCKIVSLKNIDIYNGDSSTVFDNNNSDQDLITIGPNYNASATLEGHEALDGVVYPGEYAIIARKLDVFFANYSGLNIYERKTGNLSNSDFKLALGVGLDSNDEMATSIDVLERSSGSPIINNVGDNGSYEEKSMVLNSSEAWTTSNVDSGEPQSGLNWATPGDAASGEY